jgi:hypothetical protein
MYHIAYVWTTLTSPVKHRQAGPAYNSAQNSVRADVWLPFDPGDLGTYLVQSTNQAYCYGCLCYFINAQSQAQVTLCDFTIQGVARPLCNGSKSKTVYQAAGIPSSDCSVVAGQSNLTFVVGGDVTPDYPDSYEDFTSTPTLDAFYYAGSGGGTVTPQFSINFNSTRTVYHEKTDTVCK